MRRRTTFAISLPERIARAVAAALGGTLQETATIVLPRFVRVSRLYEATAKNVLRVSIELVGGVEPPKPPDGEYEPDAGKLAVRKAAGNVVELGSIAAFGFSPLWLLAATADVVHGSRVYLQSLVLELQAAGVLKKEAELETIDDLLAALEGTSGTTARLIDVPPLELQSLRQSLEDLRRDTSGLPTPAQIAALYGGLEATAAQEDRSLLAVSVGMGLAFFNSARHVGRQHVLDPYTEDLRPLRNEGFAAYARRVGRPYAAAARKHLDPERPTLTERGLDRLKRPDA